MVNHTAPVLRKKLIEVSMPLEDINRESAREKSIRHGHPSTLHLWWARRPLASCRAVLFAQLVDDPSSWPEEFPTEEEQAEERKRLHGIIRMMVPWNTANDEKVLDRARFEIARSLARGRGEPPPRGDRKEVLAWLARHAPPVCDPFCGGGSIPLEAQRLGLRAHGSDLNPVAVLVSKATCEIPPKFAGLAPVNPDRDELIAWKGAKGLADDIRYYGAWMRDEAEERIGHLYPTVEVTRAMAKVRPDLKPYVGEDLTVIAWLWARTVASPDPKLRGAHVPLASSFVLSSKDRKKAIVVPQVDHGNAAWRFTVKVAGITADELRTARSGTKSSRGPNFACLISGSPISGDHIKAEGMAGRMRARLMAVVAEGQRGRVYLDPTEEMADIAREAEPEWRPEQNLPKNPRWFSPPDYGMPTYADLFTDRQLVALETFSDLVAPARELVLEDALEAGMDAADVRLADGGTGAQAYADAVATYLGLGVGRASDYWCSNATWAHGGAFIRNTFARQAIPMVWDFAESNPFSSASGNWNDTAIGWIERVVEMLGSTNLPAAVVQQNAAGDTRLVDDAVIATDPPYYDNIGYADLSDFFYVWHRRTLRRIWPNLYRRLLAPKDEELVATPYRHGGKDAAEQFFMEGMSDALANMHRSGSDEFPVTIYYAFKQSEMADEGLTAPGWATFLQGVVDTGYVIDGTWPVRTERTARSTSIGTNALASSIVMVCRKRSPDALVLTRQEFMVHLRSEMPVALTKIREGGVGPVDMAQASIGPGMGIFTAAAAVLEPDDTPMTVRKAIAIINEVKDEVSGEEVIGYDPDTRFCIDWFTEFGMTWRDSSDAINMAQAYGISIDELNNAGVFHARRGAARLLLREEMEQDWNPATDTRLTAWECAQHLARVLLASAGGLDAAASLYASIPQGQGDAARMLAYRLYDICERKGEAEEAQVWNTLASEWADIDARAGEIDPELQLS